MNKPQLTEEQREQVRALVKAQARDILSRGGDLKDQATVMRQIWQALVDAPTWNILHLEKPDDAPIDEVWSMVPAVKKQ